MLATTGAAEIAANSDTTAARNEGERTGATNAANRIKAILTCEEATGREPQAQHIALNTSMSVEDARGLLATFPVTNAKPATPSLAERGADVAGMSAGMTQVKPDAKASWRASLARAGAKLPPVAA